MTNNLIELSNALCVEAGREQARPHKIKEYLAKGADINYQLEQDGFTPLMLAVDRDDELLVSYLLQQGANPLIKNMHNEIASDIALLHSPIHQLLINYELLMATVLNDLDRAKTVLKAGADVNFKGKEGYTALLIAAEEGNLEFVELLIVSGADSSLTRNDGLGVYFLTIGALVYETIENGKPFTDEQKKKFLKAQGEEEDYGRWKRWRLKSLEDRNGQPFRLIQLKFTDYIPAPTESQLVELEQYFGHPLPTKMIEIFTNFNGGVPELNYLGIDGRYTISLFYAVDEKRDSAANIWWAINSYAEYLGSGTIPFAEDFDGDVYFLKWVDGKTQVWIFRYNDHGYDYDEDDYEEGQVPSEKAYLFDSLDELLEELYAARD